jgi:hypothetical protein
VKGEVPTPEQERAALAALFGMLALTIVGACALIIAIGWGLGLIARWVFG